MDGIVRNEWTTSPESVDDFIGIRTTANRISLFVEFLILHTAGIATEVTSLSNQFFQLRRVIISQSQNICDDGLCVTKP